MRIVAGTYEGGLLGWESAGSGRTLRLAFAFAAHPSSVRCLALDRHRRDTLLTGAADEAVRVFNLRGRREVGSLVEHTETVTALAFASAHYALSGDRSGAVCVWHRGDWVCMDTLRAHK